MYRGIFIYFLLLPLFSFSAQYPSPGKPLHILNFYGDNGFKHASQKSSVKMIDSICHANKWVATSSNNPGMLDSLLPSNIDLVVFNNNCGNAGSILSESQKYKFQQYIKKGGAFLAIHCAGAIWNEGPDFQKWYEQLLGATLVAHPPVQKAVFNVDDPNHIATQHLPAKWTLKEEMHTLSSNPRKHSNVLISVDESSYKGTPKMNGDHPMVWSRQFRKSKVFFSALGHTEEIYSDNDYVKMIEGGMKWCLGEKKEMNKHKPIPKGLRAPSLLIDLDADKGLFVDNAEHVYQWENQSKYEQVRYFEKQDSGRKSSCGGCPVLQKNISAINHHNALIFNESELVANNEDAFDHLIKGDGYTFFCVLSPFKQKGKLKNVNSFFGNLKNGGFYEGVWAGLTDSNQVWMGTRNGLSFGRWDVNNPSVQSNIKLSEKKFYLIIGIMDQGQDTARLSLFINDPESPVAIQFIPVNNKANASKMAIGQERDAVEHPGVESFNGAISRFLLYEQPLTRLDLIEVSNYLRKSYNIQR